MADFKFENSRPTVSVSKRLDDPNGFFTVNVVSQKDERHLYFINNTTNNSLQPKAACGVILRKP